MGCFLVLLLSRCFLSLSWVLSGTPSNSLRSLGPSLGVSWASLGDLGSLLGLLGLVGPCWASLGLLFWPIQCSFRLSWAALGRPFSNLLAQKAARQRQGSPRQPQKSPKRPPRKPKQFKSVFFVCFCWVLCQLFSGILVGRVLGRLAP